MHLLLLVLLALVAGPLASAAQLKSGLYIFKTETISNEGSPLSLTGSVVIFPQFSEKGNLYSLTIQELSLSSSMAPLPLFDLPFQFVRLDNGLIEYVNVHPSETLEMKNLKKSIVEALQTSLSPNPHSRSEAGAAGIRQAHYSSATKTDGVIMYSSHFDLSDFTSFAEFSGLEAGHVKLSGNKLVLVNEEDQSVLEGGATLKIVKGADIRIVSSTSIKFLSGDVAMIDMIQEGPFNRESLVHELNPTARLAELKARLPSLPTLISLLTSEELSTKDAIKARSQLVLLMNRDQEALNEGLAFLAQELEKSPDTKKTALVFSTLARVNAPEAQAFLAQELMKATEVPQLVIILKSLTALQNPAAPTILLKALSQIQTPKELQPLVELTIAHIAKFLDKEEAEDIVVPFLKRLQTATTDADKIHNLYLLGNTGKNAPASDIAHFLEDLSLQVRVAAITSLRSHMHIPEIQEFLAAFLKKKENFRSEPVMNTLAGAIKGKIKMMELGGKLHRALSAIPSPNKEIQELLALLGPLPELSLGGSSSTDIWNNTSDPIFNLISPSSVRQQDVDRYPNYEGYLFGAQYGPDLANLKVATGVFSGHGDDGCLAGDFKVFDKLYTEVQLLDDVLVLADLYVYFLTYNNEFDSRLYGLVNGNVIIDIKISSNCSEDEYIIFSGEIQIIFWETEIPLDIGTAYVFLDAAAFLEFEAGYRICLLTGNPYLEIYTTGEIGFLAFAGAHVTAVGILRAGIDADVFFNYVIGPDTRLGSVNNTAGELVCAACIGVYYGYDDQSAYIGAFIQRRQGLGWGEKQEIPIAEWVEPSVPYPTVLIETCAETEMSKASFSRAATASDTPLFVPSQHTKPAGEDSFTLI